LFLPKQVGTPIAPPTVNAFRQAHVLNGVEPLETSTTAAFSIPVLDANAGSIVAENATTETENFGASESINLTPKTFQSGSSWFSNQMLNANNFDFLQYVLPTLVQSKELAVEQAIASALIADAGITQTVTAASTSAVSLDNLIDLEMRLPARFNFQKAILVGAAGFAAARKLKDTTGRLLLIQDPQKQGLASINGTPVIRCDFFEAFGASKVLGVIISLLGFRLRDVTVQNLETYQAIPSKPNQKGMNLFAYHGYGWAPSAVAKLVTPAS
jgi:HK97 family phage major capsid protein